MFEKLQIKIGDFFYKNPLNPVAGFLTSTIGTGTTVYQLSGGSVILTVVGTVTAFALTSKLISQSMLLSGENNITNMLKDIKENTDLDNNTIIELVTNVIEKSYTKFLAMDEDVNRNVITDLLNKTLVEEYFGKIDSKEFMPIKDVMKNYINSTYTSFKLKGIEEKNKRKRAESIGVVFVNNENFLNKELEFNS